MCRLYPCVFHVSDSDDVAVGRSMYNRDDGRSSLLGDADALSYGAFNDIKPRERNTAAIKSLMLADQPSLESSDQHHKRALSNFRFSGIGKRLIALNNKRLAAGFKFSGIGKRSVNTAVWSKMLQCWRSRNAASHCLAPAKFGSSHTSKAASFPSQHLL